MVLQNRISYDAPGIPTDWRRGGRADPNVHISLHFLLRQQNVDVLARRLEEVSDPRSKLYGRHLSNTEVNAMTSPLPKARPAVLSFLSSFSGTLLTATPNGDILVFNLTIGAAERALGCEFFEYTRITNGDTALRTAGYTLPRTVAEHVHAVAPTVMLHSSPAGHTGPLRAPRVVGNTPKSLRALYKVGTNQGDPDKAVGNKQADTGFLGQ